MGSASALLPTWAPVCGCPAPAKGAVCICQQEWDLQEKVLDKVLVFLRQSVVMGFYGNMDRRIWPSWFLEGKWRASFMVRAWLDVLEDLLTLFHLFIFLNYFPLELQLIALFAKPRVAPVCIRPTVILYR